MEKTVCITGATGFVGLHLVLEFLNQGWKVSGISESPNHVQQAAKIARHYGEEQVKAFLGIHWHWGDIRKPETFIKAIQPVNYVVHCAGLVHGSKQDLFSINREGTANVVKLCLEKKVEKLCHISTIEALGRYHDRRHYDESSTYRESVFNSPYAQSKQAAEQEVWKGAKQGLDAVVLIPPVIVGPSNWNEGFGRTFKKIAEGTRKSHRGSNAFIDVRDLARITVLAYSSKLSGAYLVNESNNKYQLAYQIMGKHLGISSEFPPNRAIKLRFLMVLAHWFFRLGRYRILNPSHQERIRNIQSNTYSAQKFHCETGYTYIPLEQSLAFACQAFLKDYKANSES